VRIRAAVALLVALTLGGCGLGAGKSQSGAVELRVTRDFGQRQLAGAREDKIPGSQTVMRFLSSKQKITTRYGGGFVQSIDGLASTSGGSARYDWFYFVNGIEADTGAASRSVKPGDVVQWDYRRWNAAMRVPAIVGAYPEPFVHGSKGKRLPTRVECAEPGSAPCKEVQKRLSQAGVAVTLADIGVGASTDVLRVIVGTAKQAADANSAAASLERGPQRSGVFARFTDGGAGVDLLDAAGRTVRQAAPGTGLLAASAFQEESPVWLVTGVDDAGVARAASALDTAKLRNAFAVAVTGAGVEKLPLEAAR
jgi:hypothetical protein